MKTPLLLVSFNKAKNLKYLYRQTLIGHDKNPSEALTESNKLTFGHKWTMFLGMLILVVTLLIVFFLLSKIALIVGLILMLAFMPIMLGTRTHIYKKLVIEDEAKETAE